MRNYREYLELCETTTDPLLLTTLKHPAIQEFYADLGFYDEVESISFTHQIRWWEDRKKKGLPTRKPPFGKRHVLVFNHQTITYEIKDPDNVDYVEEKLKEILTANPDTSLQHHQQTLQIKIIHHERNPPTPPKEIKGFMT